MALEDAPPPSDPASRRILGVIEEELNRIVLDVHDGPVQNLFAALSQLTQLRYTLESEAHPVSADLLPRIEQVSAMVEASLHEIKFFLGTFRSPEFQRRPLQEIVESLVIQHEEWTGQTIELTCRPLSDDIALHVKIALYRILQEALSNAHRHAGVDRQSVRFWMEDDMICLRVQDKGRGFVPPPLEGPQATERQEHIGLRGMRERVALLKGDFKLRSEVGKGTMITVKVPIYG